MTSLVNLNQQSQTYDKTRQYFLTSLYFKLKQEIYLKQSIK